MKKIGFISILSTILLLNLFSGQALASSNDVKEEVLRISEETEVEGFFESDLVNELEKQEAVNEKLDEIIENVNKEIEEGKVNIKEYEYVPEIDDYVGIEFSIEVVESSVENVESSNEIVLFAAAAAKPSGIKKYSGKVNAWGFTHTLVGDFTYGDGKVKKASKEVRTSGIAFSHTRPTPTITKLDASVWQIYSKSTHKWLGKVGDITNLGYTSYITINLYGSGDARLQRATYSPGI